MGKRPNYQTRRERSEVSDIGNSSFEVPKLPNFIVPSSQKAPEVSDKFPTNWGSFLQVPKLSETWELLERVS